MAADQHVAYSWKMVRELELLSNISNSRNSASSEFPVDPCLQTYSIRDTVQKTMH